MKFMTKDAIAYSGTGWKNKGVEEEAQLIVTGHHDPDRKASGARPPGWKG